MGMKWLVLILISLVLSLPGSAIADIHGNTTYILDLTNAKEVPKKCKWSDPDRITLTPEGLGWGNRDDKGGRDVWLQTEPIGIGLSWRPTSIASIKVKVEEPGNSGMLYARYSADGKHWTSWQHLEAAPPAAGKAPGNVFQGTLRVPYREGETYHKLRLAYSQRDDVAWSSDEEALVKEILKREPKFFEKSTPFIGYVQFLYEAQLRGGQRMKGLQVEVEWWLSGKHHPPKDETARKERNLPWRFKAP
jgi:hypothetical protein